MNKSTRNSGSGQMTFGKQFWRALGVVALGALISTSAIGAVVTRLVTAGGAATTATIAPGGTVSIDVRLDVGALGAGGTGLIGTSFRLSQTAPALNGFISITGRSFVGSPFNDTASGTVDATVLTPPSNLLDPDNNDNLGRTTLSLVATPPAANTLAANLTLTASAATPPGVYTIKPTAGVSFATDDGFNDYDMSGGTFTLTVAAITLPPTIIKAFGAASIPNGGSTSLTFTLANPNAAPALTGVGFTDTLPAGLVVSTPNGLVGTCGGGTISAVAGSGSISLAGATLAGSASCNFSVNVTATTTGVKNNTTSAVTSVEGGNGGTASASVTVAVGTSPPTIAKSFGAASIPLNGATSLSFTIANPNAATALTGIGFTDTLPAGLVVQTPNGLVGTCGGGTITAVAASGSITLAGATLAGSASCNFSVNVKGTTVGAKNNTTTAVTSVEGGNGGTASASVTVAAIAPPTIAKAFGAASIANGATTSLTFTLANPNTATTLTGVGFTDTLPAGLVVSTPNGLAGTCGGGTITAVAGSGTITLAAASLAASASCNFSVNVTGATSGVKNNTTTAVTSVEGGNGGTASASVTVAAIAAPTFSKAFGGTIPLNGSTTLSFTITNPNGSPLTGVGFTDTFPAGLVVSTPNGLTGSCGGGTITAVAASGSVTLAGATLAPSASCTFSVSVTGNSLGTKVNTTSAITSVEGGSGTTATATLIVGVIPPVPTLQQWALWLLGLLMLISAGVMLRSRQKA
jgi:hypothetical protein